MECILRGGGVLSDLKMTGILVVSLSSGRSRLSDEVGGGGGAVLVIQTLSLR